MKSINFLTIPLLAAALCFAGCGKKSGGSSDSGKVNIPEGPAESMQYIAKELADANGAVLWQAMPESYQNDINSIAQLAGSKIDAEIYDKVFMTLNRVGKVLDKQKEFIFNTSLGGEEKDPDEIAQMKTAWPAIMKIMDSITSSSISSAASLQGFEGQAFFKDTVSDVLANMDAISQLQPESGQPKLSDLGELEVKYLEGTDTEATLEMTVPGQETETESFVKVENRWVPSELAADWTENMTEARSKLEALDPADLEKQKPQIMGVFTMVDGVLTQIESAETQEQFDQALQGAMMPLMGLMMMGQGMGGGGAPAMPSPPMNP